MHITLEMIPEVSSQIFINYDNPESPSLKAFMTASTKL